MEMYDSFETPPVYESAVVCNACGGLVVPWARFAPNEREQ